MASKILHNAILVAFICASEFATGSTAAVPGGAARKMQQVVQQQGSGPPAVQQGSGASPTPKKTYMPPASSGGSGNMSSPMATVVWTGSLIPSAVAGVTDTDILYFAYNLECLEGQYYSCAAFGYPLSTNITGNGPAPSSCSKAALSSAVDTYAAELSREEATHVADLYAALEAAGVNPICPFVNIDSAFEAAAEAAFGVTTPLSPTFNPASNDDFFLLGAWIFEDLGCSAYLGAQSLISGANYRGVAGQIGNAEAYHSSLLRTELYKMLDFAPAYGKTIRQITQAIVATLNKLSGSPQLKYDIFNSQGAQISNVDSKAYVPAATVAQVLNTVTLGAAKGQGGGFFPNNLNGNLRN